MAQVQVQFGGRNATTRTLETNEDLVVIRTRDRGLVQDAPLSARSRRLMDQLEPVTRFRNAGVEVFHVRTGSQDVRDLVRATLREEPAIQFAGRVLADPVFKPAAPIVATVPGAATVKEPIVYSENLFVMFSTTVAASAARQALSGVGLKVKRSVDYLDNAYFVEAPEGTGLKVFDQALALLRDGRVELCHPELLRPRDLKRAFAQQWHLQKSRVGGTNINAHAAVVDAWKRSKGKGITIAIIDTGIDVDHEEFASAGKIVAPRDTASGSLDRGNTRPQGGDEKHGTACAGVACADGVKGASGVAPEANLMPIRLVEGLGSQAEADAFAWAADNGADVISCSWGPVDGDWWDPSDPGHRANIELPDNTRLAIEYALSKGRSGKGCVITWAAGNGNESVDNDGYASHPGVIAVAACNDSGVRSAYSDTGKAIWCAFPSDDAELEPAGALPTPPPIGGVWDEDHPAPKTKGIWTTDRSSAEGYNRGGSTGAGDSAGNYTNSFGGTSSAAPGVAGVAALVLGVNGNLTRQDVRDILKRACDRIDATHGHYDPASGHSPLYGFGRLNAATAVGLASQASGTPPSRDLRRPKRRVSPGKARAARRVGRPK